MTKILAVLVWPAGIAVIFAVAALLARHAPRLADAQSRVAGTEPVEAGTGPLERAGPEDRAGPDSGSPSPLRRGSRPGPVTASRGSGLAPAAQGIMRLCLILLAGILVIYAVMVLDGLLVKHAGPAIDKPVLHWLAAHQVSWWHSAMMRATEVGDKWTVWAAAASAAVCLAVTYRTKRWLPPVALGALIVSNDILSRAIRHTVTRPLPPGPGGGPFPSGGSERAIVFYGLIAYLLWREFSHSRRAATWAAAVVAALSFNEGYSRGYLGMHWLTDILSGWFYGCLMLALFIGAVRLAAKPRRATAGAAAELASTWPHRAPAGAGSA
jgi:membrane-associated phospholipid phosphatase